MVQTSDFRFQTLVFKLQFYQMHPNTSTKNPRPILTWNFASRDQPYILLTILTTPTMPDGNITK